MDSGYPLEVGHCFHCEMNVVSLCDRPWSPRKIVPPPPSRLRSADTNRPYQQDGFPGSVSFNLFFQVIEICGELSPCLYEVLWTARELDFAVHL